MTTGEAIRERAETLLTREYHCDRETLRGKGTAYTVNPRSEEPFLKIMAYRSCVVVCSSRELHAGIQRLLQGRTRDEIFEVPLVYGQTIHYLPDANRPASPAPPPDYEVELLSGAELSSLAGLTGFENSLAFDRDGTTPTRAVCIARRGGTLIGVAGAAPSPVAGLWEVGVDVAEPHRGGGLGSCLTARLTGELLARDIVPFYSASVTNIGSQMVAARCGYLPAWVDTFGTVLDGSSGYDSILASETEHYFGEGGE